MITSFETLSELYQLSLFQHVSFPVSVGPVALERGEVKGKQKLVLIYHEQPLQVFKQGGDINRLMIQNFLL